MVKYFTTLYRKLLDYLNDSSTLTTGCHQGESRSCGLYSNLYEQELHDDKN